MFWNKNKPKEGDIRIVENYNAESRASTFTVERYEYWCGYDCGDYSWNGKQTFSSMAKALDAVEHIRKAADVKYHYV